MVLCNLAAKCIAAKKSLNVSLHVFNLHVVSVDEDLDFSLVLFLNRSMGILQFLNSIDDAFICHIDISKDFLAIIDKFSLLVQCVIQFKQLFALQCFGNL